MVARSFWPRELVLGLLALVLGFEVLLWTVYLPLGTHGVADFRQFYADAYMLRTGHARDLYDYDTQQRVQEQLVPLGAHSALPNIHPAFEEFLFVPLSLLKYRSAYLVFMAFNIGLLILCLRMLRSRLRALYERWEWFPALLLAVFYPISRAILQGQDSIVLLTLLVAMLVSLDRGNEFVAGLFLGIGGFRFQIAIPIALLFLMWRRWRFVLGFAILSTVAGGISWWIVGTQGMRHYVSTLMSMSVHLNSTSDMFRYAVTPTSMFNLRGLVSGLMAGRISQFWVQLVIFAASALVLLLAAKQRPSLPLAITASALVSYHFNAHDASILFIPVVLALSAERVWAAASGVLLLITSTATVVPQYGYLAALPLLAFFIANSGLLPEQSYFTAPTRVTSQTGRYSWQ